MSWPLFLGMWLDETLLSVLVYVLVERWAERRQRRRFPRQDSPVPGSVNRGPLREL